ncbi:hypothetical protein ABPG74_004919 [Tetrahymena malaccensis]
MSTFEQNLNTLLKLKQEVLGLKINYSSEIHNYHNLHMLEAQSSQLKNAYDEIDNLKQNTFDSQSKFNDLTRELKTYNEQLKKENIFLAQENSHLKNQVSNYQSGFEQKDVELYSKIKEKEQEINKYKRELENLKLMHSQELYILKKNAKK